MKFKLFFVVIPAFLFVSCFQGEQGPQGLVGPKGNDGKNYEVKDSLIISNANRLKIPAIKNWIKSGIRVNFGEIIILRATTNIPESSSNGGLSAFLVNEQINSLYMKIGVGNSGHIKIGKSYFGFAQETGEIEFGINTIDVSADSSQFYSIDSLVIRKEQTN